MTDTPEYRVWGHVERRKKPRLVETLPVFVSGVDSAGESFQAHTILDNLSACGLYMQLPRCVDPGASLEILIQYSDDLSVARIAMSGIVRRAEERTHGLYGLGVEFTKYHFIPPSHFEGEGANQVGCS